MEPDTEQCARELLESAPLVVRFIRNQIRQHHPAGLSLPQFRALAFMGRVPQPSLSAIAKHLGLSLPAMSRMMNGLVEKGFVDRTRVKTNRRQLAVALTSRGESALERVRSLARQRLATALSSLSPSERHSIHSSAQVLRRIFDVRTGMDSRMKPKQESSRKSTAYENGND